MELYRFRAGFLSIIRSPALYTQQYVCHTGYGDCLLAASSWPRSYPCNCIFISTYLAIMYSYTWSKWDKICL